MGGASECIPLGPAFAANESDARMLGTQSDASMRDVICEALVESGISLPRQEVDTLCAKLRPSLWSSFSVSQAPSLVSVPSDVAQESSWTSDIVPDLPSERPPRVPTRLMAHGQRSPNGDQVSVIF